MVLTSIVLYGITHVGNNSCHFQQDETVERYNTKRYKFHISNSHIYDDVSTTLCTQDSADLKRFYCGTVKVYGILIDNFGSSVCEEIDERGFF